MHTTLKRLVVSQLVCAIAVRFVTLASGWTADPTFPFGLFTPFVILPMLLYAALVAPAAIVSLSLSRKFRATTRSTLAAIALSFLGSMIAVPIPPTPSADDAFEWRMGTFSEAQFQALAHDIRRELEDRRLEKQPRESDDAIRRRVVQSLRNEHAILRIDGFRPRFFVREDRVSIYWASGLTGGFEVTVFDGEEIPDDLPPPNIHRTVAAYVKD
jgi:hypothetical protein